MDKSSPAEIKIHGLITRLDDPSVDVRHEVMQSLSAMGEPAIEPLIQVLEEAPDNDHRWYAAVALSGIGALAVDPLISAMKDHKDNEFRRYAASETIGW